MPDQVEDLLRSLPDGACTECLARLDGQRREDIEAIIDQYLTHLPLRVHHGLCPGCGRVGRVVQLVDAQNDVSG
jgi:hypothetical protein